jgi:quinol-cytochrome oxidoreductase complex cytochrome b subunit
MLVSFSREEEDLENIYIDDFFWIHERGVDVIIISSFTHLLRKIYLGIHDLEQEIAWKTGVFSFLIIQVTIFAGLVLCTTHLSEITLTIAVNALHTFFLFTGKPYWWIFTDKSLNSDTLVRMMYLHYIIAFYLLFLGILHGVDMHYDWKPKAFYSGINTQMNWWDEALFNELCLLVNFLIVILCLAEFFYIQPEALSYEIFMWGDIGMVTDVRYYGVAPHWYFRPYMAWLIACPYHHIGIFGLVYFFVVLFFQVTLFGNTELDHYKYYNSAYLFITNLYLIIERFLFLRYFIPAKYLDKLIGYIYFKVANDWNVINYDVSFQWLASYSIFLVSVFYTGSFLPYGRFYNKLGGNFWLLVAYFYIFSFLTFMFLRNSWIGNNKKYNVLNY